MKTIRPVIPWRRPDSSYGPPPAHRRTLLRCAAACIATGLLALGLVGVIAGPAGAATVSTWTRLTPDPSPSSRVGTSMAEDPVYERTVLFGGVSGGTYFGDTWTFDGTTKTWTEQHPSTHPSARAYAAMATDSSNKVVLFGGSNGAGKLSDTWVYDLVTNQWSQASATGPAARDKASMAASPGGVLLFGGQDALPQPLDDTWIYQPEVNQWVQLTLTTKPSARYAAALTSSEYPGLSGSGFQGPVLFGGWSWNGFENDTWTFTGSNWVKQTPTASPPDRAQAAMGYDPVHRQVVLFGGYGDSGYLADTWTYNGATWTQASPIGSPAALRWQAPLVTSNWTTGETVLFGNGSSDTWIYRTVDPPSAPTSPSAVSGDTQVQLTWTAPTSDGGSAVLGYNVYVGTTPGGESGTPKNGGTLVPGTSYTATGLTNGTYYWINVTAVNAAGESPRSIETMARPRAPGTTEGTWLQRSPSTAPSARVLPSMAENPLTGDPVLFGGRSASVNFNDTWTYDNGTGQWTQRSPTDNPEGRYGAAMAYDSHSGLIVLFGGMNYWDGWLSDTWVYDLTTHQWTERHPATHPPGREEAMMSSSSDGLILFGGYTYPGGYLGDTWLYDAINDRWTQQSPATSPSARSEASMASAYDGLAGRTAGYYGPVLFGGQNGATTFGETWTYEWQGSTTGWTWVRQSPTWGPPARSLAAMGYDPGKKRMVLFGGTSSTTGLPRLADTWTYDGNLWLPATPDQSPSARVGAAMAASDWRTGPMVLFGGTSASGFLSDTWIYDPVAANDTYAMVEDTVLTVDVPGVLANDSTTDGTLTVSSSTTATQGTVALSADGSFTYTPPRHFYGVVSFTYTAQGTRRAGTATVQITVSPAVTVAVPDAYSMRQGATLSVSASDGVLANDTGVFTGVYLPSLVHAGHGTLTLNGDGSFSYTPTATWYGTDTFTYTLDDLQRNKTGTVTITVIEGVPPDTTITAGPSSPTSATSASFSFSGSDNVTPAGDLTYQARLDGGAFTAATSPVNYTGLAEGTHTFEVKATDAAGNEDPTAASWTWTVDTTPPETSILTHPADPTQRTDAAFTYSGTDAVSPPANLTFSASLDGGAFVAVPAGGISYPSVGFGAHTFSVKARDAAGNEDQSPAVFSWTAVDLGNHAPDAVDDSGYATDEDAPLSVGAPGVLGNDQDADHDTLTVSSSTPPTHGQLSLRTDGSFVYTPPPNWSGVDSFTYQASDGNAEDWATVTVTVNPVDDPPVAANASFGLSEDEPLSMDLGPKVTDVDSAALTIEVVGAPAHGTVHTATPGVEDGKLVYTPDADYSGGDSFTYQASDGTSSSNLATVTLTIESVYDMPVAVDDSYSVDAGTTLTVAAPGIFANDLDPEHSGFWYALFWGPHHGTLLPDYTEDGGFVYRPATGYSGVDTFTYTLVDQWGYSPDVDGTVTITVTAANTAPVAQADTYAATEDQVLSVTAVAAGVLGNDSDVDGDTLTAVLGTGPAHGSLTLNTDGSFTYTPAANYDGADSFTYKASDGTDQSGLVTVSVVVAAVNDAPVAADDSYSTGEDQPLTVPATSGVLANDTDVDGDTLSAVLGTGPAHGTLTLNANGSFTYTPAANYHGPDSFTYRASDGTAQSGLATVSITVTSVNDPPVAAADTYAATEDEALSVTAVTAGVLGNDSDPDGDALTAVLGTGPAHGSLTLNPDGSFTYTPAANYHGPDSFTYQASDGTAQSDAATVSIVVAAVNDAPVAAGDSYSTAEDEALTVPAATGVLANDTDTDGDPLAAVLGTGPAHGSLTLNSDGSFTYTPAANYHGPDGFTYQASDGTAQSDLATVTITVTSVNDPPVAQGDTYTTAEDQALSVTAVAAGVLGNDSDPDGDALTAVLGTGPAHGSLTLNADGSFTYTSAANYNGADGFTYKASDGTAQSGATTVAITVTSMNDVPVAVADAYSVDEDAELTIGGAGVLANDTHPDADLPTAAVEAGPAHGALTLHSDGSFVYTPYANYNGSDGFTYRAADNDPSQSAPAAVTITVNSVNDVPVAQADTYVTDEDTPLITGATSGVLGNDVHPDADPPTAMLGTEPTHGTLTLNSDGSFTYTPAANYHGPDSFTYRAADIEPSYSGLVTVHLTVNSVNDPPTVNPPTATSSAQYSDAITAVDLTGTDIDTNRDQLSFSATGLPAGVTVTDHGDGTATVSGTVTGPAGSYPAIVTVSDGQGGTATAAVTITVTKEGGTVAYAGDLMFSSATGSAVPITLKAQVTEVADSAAGNLGLAKVRFRLYQSTDISLSNPIVVYGFANASTGVATATATLVLDTWTVRTDIDPDNGYYTASEPDPMVVIVYQPIAGKYATGGGWIADPTTSNPPIHANFGFSVRYGKNASDPKGQSVYIYRDGKYDYIVKSNSWTGGGLAFSTNSAGAGGVTFSAKASVTVIDRTTGLVVPSLGGGNFKIRIDATDAVKLDTYAITVYRSTGQLFHQDGTPAAQVPLGGGNIVIHAR